MGCSLTKELESPAGKPKDPWGSVIPKGLAAEVDRNLKATDGGYIAAIFSANYGSLKTMGSIKGVEKDELRRPLGKYPQHKVSKTAHNQLTRKSWPDLKVGLPLRNTENDKEPETINTWELMQGLDDDDKDGSALLAAVEFVNSAKVLPNSQTADAEVDLPFNAHSDIIDKHVLNDRSKDAPGIWPKRRTEHRRARPKSFSVIHTVDDVHVAVALRKSKTPPPEWETSLFTAQDKEALESKEPVMTNDLQKTSYGPLHDKAASVHLAADSGKVAVGRNSDNLQRALSFKYILNDQDSSDFVKSFSNKSSHAESFVDNLNRTESFADNASRAESFANNSSHAESFADERDFSSDSIIFRLRLIQDGDLMSSPSSPDFSTAASLKDWLPDSHLVKQPESMRTGLRHSNLGNAEDPNSSSEAKKHAVDPFLNTRSVRSKYVGGVPYQPSSETSNQSSDKGESPVFDPDLVESFEKAIEQLSEEEWNAVKSMEDSPRNFIRMVNSLQRSCSNTSPPHRSPAKVDAAQVGSDGNKVAEACGECFVKASSEGNHIQPPLEERKSSISRQSSWDLRKTTATGGRREDDLRGHLVFYSTSSESDGQGFEDCNVVRAIVRSLVGPSFDERSISEHPHHAEELKHVLDMPTVVVPTIVVKGKCIVGVDSILQMQKKGVLGSLLKEALAVGVKGKPLCICRGGKLLVCPVCKGRRKLIWHGDSITTCRHCSGAGLIKCTNCSS